MKKLCIVIVSILLASLVCVPCFAESFDFEKDFFPGGVIETPAKAPLLGVIDRYEDGAPDHTHINFFYFMTEDMLKLCDSIVRFEQDDVDWQEKYDLCSFGTYIQVDVKFNDGDWFSSQSDWDAREYPDECGGRDLQLIFEDDVYTGNVDQLRSFTQSWLTYHDGDNFLTPYLKTEKGPDGNLWQFDLEDGSMTYRYRFAVEYDKENDDEDAKCIFSGWSPETVIGKGSTMKEPECTKTEAPVLSDFSLDVDSEGVATARYYLELPDSVYDNYLYYALRDDAFEMYGFEAQLSVNGGEWTDLDFEGPRSLWSGFRAARNENITSVDDEVSIRVRLVCDKEDLGDSPWSNIVGNVAEKGEQITTETAETEAPEEGSVGTAPAATAAEEKSGCKLCHICPVQPLGICLFVWIAAVVVVAAVIIIIIACKKKKRK